MSEKSTFLEVRLTDVGPKLEKKGQLTYLSWANAVDYLLQKDDGATWEFLEPKNYGKTMMVSVKLTAFGKTIPMQLPVMDNRNNAIIDPNARQISDAQMRCLTKAIACFGIGLYVYAGEDLPDDIETQSQPSKVNDGSKSNPGLFLINFGKKYKGLRLNQLTADDAYGYASWLDEQSQKSGKTMSQEVIDFCNAVDQFFGTPQQYDAGPNL